MLFATISGRKLDLRDIQPKDIDIFDIAHSLSRQCRFSGHCVEFYSVAQHSLRVAALLPTELKMVGLLHDAAEAYLGDITRPVKELFPGIEVIEKAIWRSIAKRWCLPDELPQEVVDADNLILQVELMELCPAHKQDEVKIEIPPAAAVEKILTPPEAQEQFINLFRELVML